MNCNMVRIGNYRLVCFYCICILCALIPLVIFTHTIDSATTPVKDIAILGTECMLIFAPLWIVAKRLRWISCLIICVCNLFLFANVLYYRYWQDLIPIYSIFDHACYNSFVFNSIASLTTYSDCIYLVFPAFSVVAFHWLRIASLESLPLNKSLGVITFSVTCFLAVFILTINSRKNYRNSVGDYNFTFSDSFMEKFAPSSSRTYQWQNNGLICYLTSQMLHISDYSQLKLSTEEMAEINEFIKYTYDISPTDSLQAFKGNTKKNLILIIVESLNANIINKRVNSHEITPTLNRLSIQNGTICCFNVMSQVKDGGSADGQMIYNTGLLPIKNGAAAMLFGTNEFISLADVLKKTEAKEIIAESSNIWNHRITSEKYGYQYLIDNVSNEMDGSNKSGHDAAVFNAAIKEIPNMKQPFMLELTTLSMHFPFIDPNAETAAFLKNIEDSVPENIANYYRMTNYFDTQLDKFLSALNEKCYYDNSVIVIASDHNDVKGSNESETDTPIVFMALNTGCTKRIDRITAQVDAFPTILEIMDADAMSGWGWNGLGISMLHSDNNSAADNRGILHGHSNSTIDRQKLDAWEISDMIIRSDYFSSYMKSD